eukprot:TRINITY_DN8880_c0_g1_i1.p1 TRINITY_DN8880_c0_g1~~TRINITY_DN8880_c0_g1_i1.p1  ORF type:complete len:164 (+),score=39.69 TRINITY_DN8880_c0_g1_i1:70-561(+)
MALSLKEIEKEIELRMQSMQSQFNFKKKKKKVTDDEAFKLKLQAKQKDLETLTDPKSLEVGVLLYFINQNQNRSGIIVFNLNELPLFQTMKTQLGNEILRISENVVLIEDRRIEITSTTTEDKQQTTVPSYPAPKATIPLKILPTFEAPPKANFPSLPLPIIK